MIPLTRYAAILNKRAIGITYHQFYVINFSDATGSTAQRLAYFSTCCVAAAALLSIVDHHITITAVVGWALGIEVATEVKVEVEAEPRACMREVDWLTNISHRDE